MSAVATTGLSRRLAARVAARASRFSEEERAWGGLAVAMAVSAAVLLWEGRHITFEADELTYFQYFRTFDLTSLLTPHNAHLILVTRLIYTGIFQTVGPVHAVFAAVELFGVLLCAGLFFLLAKRRVGAVVALALTLPLLFFGSSWDAVLSTLGIPTLYSFAAGLGALLALERRDTAGDVAACLLLCLSVATHSFGLPFLVGAAVYVLVPPDRRRRAWIFLLPALAYGAWWVWALRFDQTAIEQPSNVLLTPNYIADSLAAVSGSLAGLNYPIGSSTFLSPIDIGWGRVLALVALAAFWLRLRRGDTPLSLWVVLAVLLTMWTLLAVTSSPTGTPEQTRYLFPGALLLLLVAAEALRGVRLSRLGLLALFGAVAFGLAANLKILHDESVHATDLANKARAELAMVELSREWVDPGLRLSDASRDPDDRLNFPGFAGRYLAAVDDTGSFAFSPQGVLQQDEPVREDADFMLTHALGLEFESGQQPPSLRGCEEKRPTETSEPIVFSLPPDGAMFRPPSAGFGQVELRRFADSYSVPLEVPPGEEWITLRIPADSAPQPWWAAISSPGAATMCPLRS